MEAKDIYVGTLAQYAKVGFLNIVVNDLIDLSIIFIYGRMSRGGFDRNINWVGRGKEKERKKPEIRLLSYLSFLLEKF